MPRAEAKHTIEIDLGQLGRIFLEKETEQFVRLSEFYICHPYAVLSVAYETSSGQIVRCTNAEFQERMVFVG